MKKTTDFRTEKEPQLYGRERNCCFADGERNGRALRTGKGREFSDRERNGSFADDGRNCGFAGIRGEHACSFADSPDCVYFINNIKT